MLGWPTSGSSRLVDIPFAGEIESRGNTFTRNQGNISSSLPASLQYSSYHLHPPALQLYLQIIPSHSHPHHSNYPLPPLTIFLTMKSPKPRRLDPLECLSPLVVHLGSYPGFRTNSWSALGPRRRTVRASCNASVRWRSRGI